MTKPALDIEFAHRHFSAECFNRAWGYIDRAERDSDETEQMILLAAASLWHWTQRPDCTARHRSIGYWQLARVYALAGEANNARKYARCCLTVTPADDAFCRGFAHEAMARAERVAGNRAEAAAQLEQARAWAERVESAEDKSLLLSDLQSLA